MHLAALTTPDTIVLALCAIMAIRGAFKGFAWQAVKVVGLAAAVAGALAWDEIVGDWLVARISFLPEGAAPSIGFVVVFLGLLLIATWLAWMARGFVDKIRLKELDRTLGFVLGGALGLVFATIGFVLWGSWVPSEKLKSTLQDSVSVRYMAEVVDVIEPILPDDIRRRWSGVLHTLDEVTPPRNSDDAP